jgi:hypothetical protein
VVDLPKARVALVVLRCWTEDGSRAGFRAHLTLTEDVSGDDSTSLYAATPDEVTQAVRALMDTVAPSAGELSEP